MGRNDSWCILFWKTRESSPPPTPLILESEIKDYYVLSGIIFMIICMYSYTYISFKMLKLVKKKIKSFFVGVTVWPQPIWKKVRTSWQIIPQHQRKYLGGPKSAWIEIPPFRRFFWCKFSKMKIFKNFWIAPKFFFA